jgi:hypothetical protein
MSQKSNQQERQLRDLITKTQKLLLQFPSRLAQLETALQKEKAMLVGKLSTCHDDAIVARLEQINEQLAFFNRSTIWFNEIPAIAEVN